MCQCTNDLPCVQILEGSSTLAQVFIASLLLESRYSNKRECVLQDVASRASTAWKNRPPPPAALAAAAATAAAARSDGAGQSKRTVTPHAAAARDAVPVLESHRLQTVLRQLEACSMVLVSLRARNWGCLVALNIPTDDAVHVLRQSERVAWLHGMLGAVA
jgi:hypothetical protein